MNLEGPDAPLKAHEFGDPPRRHQTFAPVFHG